MSQYQNYPAPHSPSTNTDFSYPNFPGATNNQLGNFAQPAPRFDAAHFQQQVNRTMTHGQAVLQCRKASIAGRGGQGMGKAPVWTPHKAWLSEALDYVGRHIGRKKGMGGKGRGETFVGEMVGVDGAGAHEEGEHDGEVVVSLVLGPGGVDDEEDDTDDDGEHVDVRMRRTWLDGETVICEVATGLRSRKEKGRVLRAWDRTWQKGTSVVVIVGRGWGEAERCVPWPSQYAQWAVLDHLRVAEYWMEKRLAAGGKYEGVGVVKLQKAELHKESWWMVGREGAPGILPLDQRRFWGARWEESKRIGCTTCEEASPMVYKECWICLNQKCRNFWREGLEVAEDGSLNPVDIPRKLKFNADFLMARSMFEKDAKPSWELVPDLAQGFRTWKDSKTVLGITRSRLAWRGMVCQMCKSIVPKTQWCRWECENEDCRKRTGSPWFFDLDLGGVPLQSVVPRSFVSWKGHPLLEPTWADGLAGRTKREYRPTYLVDTWSGSDFMLKVISPTAEFNMRQSGPDQLFRQLLMDANQGDRGLGLTRSNRYPKLDDYFHKTFGVEYGLSAGKRRRSIARAKPLDTNPHVADASALLAEVVDREVGAGGFAYDKPNSLQVHAYMEGMNLPWHVDSQGDLGNTIATLCLGGDAVLHIRDGGEDVDEELRLSAQTRVPLIHGSIVLTYGAFDSNFEHKIECSGPLRFAVTSRYVNQAYRANMILNSQEVDCRYNGQLFIESSDEESEAEDVAPPPQSTRGGRVAPKPITRPAPNKRRRSREMSDSPQPAQRRRRSASPGDFKDPGWTQAQKDSIYRWKQEGLTYKQIADRAERSFNLTGRVNPENLRMVINREKNRRKKRAELLGEDDTSSVAPSDWASAVGPRVTFEGEQIGDPTLWTHDEVERLLDYRSRDPPLTYKDIREIEEYRRTEKAYREQMTSQNRKKKGVDRPNRGIYRPNTNPYGPGSPMSRHEDDSDVDMTDEVRPPAQPMPRASLRQTRASQAGRNRSMVDPGPSPMPATTRASRGSRARGSATMDGLEGPGTGAPSTRTRTRSQNL